MNRDHKLLEEAYQSIYESATEPLYFGPEEDKQKWMEWLNKLMHEVHEDGSVSIRGNVDLDYKKITRIPFSFEIIEGNFSCSFNMLTSLEGSPSFVKGFFRCTENNLASLEGAPSVVGDYFACSFNNITSLKGAPDSIKTSFYCNDNKLTSLEGAPSFVGEKFSCDVNNIASLQGAPREVKGVFKSDNFSDEDYRKYIRDLEVHDKFVKGKLEKDFDIDLQDF